MQIYVCRCLISNLTVPITGGPEISISYGPISRPPCLGTLLLYFNLQPLQNSLDKIALLDVVLILERLIKLLTISLFY